MQKQPLTHRSKIKRNNKKGINVNNFNTNKNTNYKCDNFYFDNQKNKINENFNRDSYLKDTEISKNNFNENIELDRFIKPSLNDMIISKNDYLNNSTNYNDDMKLNDNNIDSIIRYNEVENFNEEKNDFIKDKSKEINNDEGNMIYNPINTNTSQKIDINEFENKIKDKENNINVKDLYLVNNNFKDNDLVNMKEINNEDKTNINEEKDLSDNTKENGKKKISVKKSKEELQYESIIVELFKNNEIIDLLDSRKWEEKKQGFIKLNQSINQGIKDSSINETIFQNIFMYIALKLNNFKETNFNILKEGILCLTTLFSYYKGKNTSADKKYLDKLLFGLNEKITDPKIKEVYIQLLKELIEIYSNKTVYDLLFQILLTTNKVTVLKEYSIYIRDNIKSKNSISDIDLKNLIDFSVKIANHTNPQIRSISIEIICLLYKFIGPDLKRLICGIKEATLKLIEKELEKINYNDSENDNNSNNKVKDLLISNNISNNKMKKKNNSNINNSTIIQIITKGLILVKK